MSRTPPLYDAEVRELKEAEEAFHVVLMYATQYRLDGTKLAIVAAIKEIDLRRLRLESGELEP